jgi:predicted amidophosphoribosyltransferase
MIDDYEKKSEKEQCSECKKWVRELVEDSGVCERCLEKFEE